MAKLIFKEGILSMSDSEAISIVAKIYNMDEKNAEVLFNKSTVAFEAKINPSKEFISLWSKQNHCEYNNVSRERAILVK